MGNDDARPLTARLPCPPIDSDALLDAFLDWTMDLGIELYLLKKKQFLRCSLGRRDSQHPDRFGKIPRRSCATLLICSGKRSYYLAHQGACQREILFPLPDHEQKYRSYDRGRHG